MQHASLQHWPPSNDAAGRRAAAYALLSVAPPPPSDEVERRELLAIEVVHLWSGDILAVSHVNAPGSVHIGERGDCGVALPHELLGADRLCVAVASRTEICAVLPARARAVLTLPGGASRAYESASGATPLEGAGVAPERVLPLGIGARVHLHFGSFEVQIAAVAAGRRLRRSFGHAASILPHLGAVTLGVAAIIGSFSLLEPPRGLNQHERAAGEQVLELRSYLEAAAEREAAVRERDGAPAAQEVPAARSSARSSPAQRPGWSGAEADPQPPTATGLLAKPTTGSPRSEEIEEARHFGAIAIMAKALRELADPRLVYRRPMSSEELATMERLFNSGSAVGEDPSGLALSGTGIGAGHKGQAIAAGDVRTINGGEGGEVARVPGEGWREPNLAHARAPRREESITSDPLPTATIRRVLHSERGTLQRCFARAHAGVPSPETSLPDTALLRFIVQRDGRVADVNASEPPLPPTVRSCIEGVLYGLTFPNPELRPVPVAYRMALAPT